MENKMKKFVWKNICKMLPQENSKLKRQNCIFEEIKSILIYGVTDNHNPLETIIPLQVLPKLIKIL